MRNGWNNIQIIVNNDLSNDFYSSIFNNFDYSKKHRTLTIKIFNLD